MRILTVVILFCAVVLYLGLTVYPFQYGRLESAVVAGTVLLLAVYELFEHSEV